LKEIKINSDQIKEELNKKDIKNTRARVFYCIFLKVEQAQRMQTTCTKSRLKYLM